MSYNNELQLIYKSIIYNLASMIIEIKIITNLEIDKT